MPFAPATRRQFLRIGAAAAVAGLGADMVLLAPNLPRIVRKDIALSRWPAKLDGFSIALLSDFHFDPYFSVRPLRAAINMVNDLQPDLIVLTGDFVSATLVAIETKKKIATAVEPCARLLQQMQSRHGLWAVLGNHDALTDPSHIVDVLHNAGIRVLLDESVPIERNGGRFWLSGVKDVMEQKPSLDAALHGIPGDESVILLAHEPDYADVVARHNVDLQLSGHSHGGQVRIPYLRPPFLPELARKYIRGFYKIGGLTLYTNPGLGTVVLPIRLNCPPEITLLTLRRG